MPRVHGASREFAVLSLTGWFPGAAPLLGRTRVVSDRKRNKLHLLDAAPSVSRGPGYGYLRVVTP